MLLAVREFGYAVCGHRKHFMLLKSQCLWSTGWGVTSMMFMNLNVCLFSFLLPSFFGVFVFEPFFSLNLTLFSIPVISFIFVIRHWDCSSKWPSPFLHALFGRKLRNMWSRNLHSARRYCADMSGRQHINALGDGPWCYNTTLPSKMCPLLQPRHECYVITDCFMVRSGAFFFHRNSLLSGESSWLEKSKNQGWNLSLLFC